MIQIKLVAQETPMGCGIASVANVVQASFKEVLKRAKYKEEKSWNQGYYCRELVSILKKFGLDYSFSKVSLKTKQLVKKEKSIVFCKGKIEIFGHYLVRLKGGWIDPWINFPYMTPSRAGFVKKLPDKPRWIIYPNN